jgi:predicted nucleic acid-binding protein
LVVADASPLIALARIGRLELCHALFNEVVIPQAVAGEILRHPRGFEGEPPPWLAIRRVVDRQKVEELNQRLDLGEAEALVLALELGVPLLMDESQGRRMAGVLGIDVIGTLGLLLASKRAGLLVRVDAEVARLRAEDFFMGDDLLRAILDAANEG